MHEVSHHQVLKYARTAFQDNLIYHAWSNSLLRTFLRGGYFRLGRSRKITNFSHVYTCKYASTIFMKAASSSSWSWQLLSYWCCHVDISVSRIWTGFVSMVGTLLVWDNINLVGAHLARRFSPTPGCHNDLDRDFDILWSMLRDCTVHRFNGLLRWISVAGCDRSTRREQSIAKTWSCHRKRSQSCRSRARQTDEERLQMDKLNAVNQGFLSKFWSGVQSLQTSLTTQ